ncbi:smad nuclear-interacting protein 1 [Apodemus sylvaticus]|uniref:smad nuclear-interacting protein 1 n=1 Tax=Apodemus sylvaticus TaxID=10129 RepID=UPI002243E86A|nr:smad nuclear-interacting protein 1 [Apodemus sylvaticus]
MKVGKSERERSGRRRHRSGDALATVVVKQERLSPEPVAHRRPDAPAASLSPPAAEPGRSGHRGSRARSPAKKKSKSSGRRSKSPRAKRSRSPHYSTVKVKQEREDHPHPRRGREDRQPRESSEQGHRRARNSDRDRHRGHSRQGRSSEERPVGGQGRDRDSQNLQAQEEERDFHNARRREHRQQNESAGSEAPEVIPRPAGNRSKEVPVKEKPSFELSGALLEDTNTFRGVVIKYSEPPEARIPKKRWRLYPFKNDEVLPVMYIHRQSAYLLGRHRRIADIPIDHPSCSKQHAVFQYRLVEYTRADGTVGRRVKPYIIDLGSGNGTFLNNKRIEPQRYYELKEKDVLKFGFSSREYVLLHESSDTSELDRKEDEDDEEEEMVSDS